MPDLPLTVLYVLLVEDDDAYAGLLTSELAALRTPLRLQRVASFRAALDALAAMPPDAILLDLVLPDSTGLVTVERMHAAAPDVPIVVVTSHDDEAMALDAVKHGADDYLVKGWADGHAVARAIRYARERSALRRTLVAREEQLRQAHKMEAVGRLAGGIAHDFNNVLTAILGYAELLLDQFDESDPRRADVLEIRRSADRAANLTRQLLAFSRKQVMQPRVLSLNDVVGGMAGLLKRLVGEDVVIEVSTDPGLWAVRADAGQVEQVIMNLAANARDAMPAGGRLTLATGNRAVETMDPRATPGLHPGEYAWLAVTDTGGGIPDDVRPHIFEPFFTTRPMGKGTGLGLATVYGIVKQMGGGIYLEPVEGTGTRFRVYLPRVPAEAPTSAV
jgi:two-component system, cell cycle sensor histidine kinase and response regulator CckA